MKKTSLRVMAIAGTMAFGAVNLASPTPAHAACSDDAMMAKEMAMKVTDTMAKDMALKHVAMADEKAKAGMEDDCMAEVMKANEAIKGKEMMDDKMDNKTSG